MVSAVSVAGVLAGALAGGGVEIRLSPVSAIRPGVAGHIVVVVLVTP